MHFAIPETQELFAELAYTGYKIYINGFYHCCLRYKQLLALHELLRRRCPSDVVFPKFPPKRLLPLTINQVESRRAALEHYLQLVGQTAQIAKLDAFQTFLLNAQMETAVLEGMLEDCGDFGPPQSPSSSTTLDVWLMNGYKFQVNCHIGDNTNTVLRQACERLEVPQHKVPYFCLYLIRNDPKDTLLLLRRLMDFESPYLSRQHAMPCQILLRKSYWDPMYDLELMQHSVTLNLLYVQTVSDVERDWVIATPEIKQKLRSLQKHGLKKDYIEAVRQLPLYGCLQFANADVDYPEAHTTALISIGNKELSMRSSKGSKVYETKFRVTRMRCWRVTALHNTLESKEMPTNLQLSFEYLMSKQSMRWITISSAQAMLMSVCLQNMVDELLQLHCSNDSPQSQTESPTYGERNSQSRISTSSSTPSFSNDISPTSTTTSASSSSNTSSPTPPVKFLTQKPTTQRTTKSNPYSAVFFRNIQESVHNEAFEGIGDDDL